MSKSTEFWGAVKYMPENVLEERLKKAQSDTIELLAEKDRRTAFTPEMKLCDRLHHLMHYAIDCDYHYSDWPDAKGCRHDYLMLTHQLLHTLAIDVEPKTQVLDALLALMEKVRYGAV